MESWMTSLIAGMFSSLIVGVIMATFQKNLNKSVDDAKEANELKFKGLEDKFQIVSEKAKSMEMKLDNLSLLTTNMDKRVAIVVAEQKHMSESIKNMSEDVKHISVNANFGKVVRKP